MDINSENKSLLIVGGSFFIKIKNFIAAFLLAEVIIGSAIYIFIENLNRKGILGLGTDFQAHQMIWGESIWLNILRLIILGFIAGIFGFIFGYLSRGIRFFDKVLFTCFYVFIRFIFIFLIYLFLEFFMSSAITTWNDIIDLTILQIKFSLYNTTYVILGYVITFITAFFCIDKGREVINNPMYSFDKRLNNTFLDVKWYHFFWLYLPISVFTQVLLNLLYLVGQIIFIFIEDFKWYNIFGGSEGEKGNAIEVAWGSLLIVFIMAIIVIYLMNYLRMVLSGKTNQHIAIKILISIGIGIILPLLIILFTPLAG